MDKEVGKGRLEGLILGHKRFKEGPPSLALGGGHWNTVSAWKRLDLCKGNPLEGKWLWGGAAPGGSLPQRPPLTRGRESFPPGQDPHPTWVTQFSPSPPHPRRSIPACRRDLVGGQI